MMIPKRATGYPKWGWVSQGARGGARRRRTGSEALSNGQALSAGQALSHIVAMRGSWPKSLDPQRRGGRQSDRITDPLNDTEATEGRCDVQYLH